MNKRTTSKYFLLHYFTVFIICFGVISNVFAGSYSFSKQFSSQNSSASKFLKEIKAVDKNSPSLPQIPISEDKLEEKTSDTDDDQQDLLTYSESVFDDYTNYLFFVFNSKPSFSVFCTTKLPLYILFHSWKSFLD